MDTDTTGNHASFNQNSGMWKAYGLVYKLLQNGVPVYWGIKAYPTKNFNDIDFTVTAVTDKRLGTNLSSYDYRGGPFIIDSTNVAVANPIITAWWAAKGNQPNVHVAGASFSSNVDIILRSPPRIANEAINAGITIAYYNAAGIPDLNGNPWSTTSPNVLDETEIASGALFATGVCQSRQFDIFVTPHNSGYAYSLSDPTNLGTKTYAAFDNFVHQGGGWTALCHSILSNENFISDLTRNGNASVKALFKTSLPGGQPGGFLTTTGFSTISNVGGTWAVVPPAAGLSVEQMVATTGATQGLPGGSVQDWPASGGGAPTYYAQTERLDAFTSAGVSYDHSLAGTYHNATGTGKVTFIGGHSFSTALPYSTNAVGPYLRTFYNSLFFNGTAVSKIDLLVSPASVPQNSTNPVLVSITNTGSTDASNVNTVSITLASGFTYSSTTSGPGPDTVAGQTLTWNNLGTVAGGATAVTIQVAVAGSVTSTTGTKSIGSFHANYGDNFGEGFTADVCREIAVVAAPGPQITKLPASQGPVFPDSQVTWTLNYSNVGTQSLLSPVVTDTLPAGFVYVSASPAPSLVIPGSPTILKWNLATLASNASGSITLNALAGPITSGTGNPVQQVFTNTVTLTGNDASNNSYSGSATATVTVQKPPIDLQKSVNQSFVALPGNVTYTLTPVYTGTVLLQAASVSDVIPGADNVTPAVSPYATLVTPVSPDFPTGYCNGDSSGACVAASAYEVDWDLGSNTPGIQGTSAAAGSYLCPNTVVLVADAYTYIDESNTTKNTGNATQLFTNPGANNTKTSTKHTLVHFDLSAIPSTATVQAASVRMTVVTTKTKHSDQVHEMLTAWTEGNGTVGSGASWSDPNGAAAGGWLSGASFGTSRPSALCASWPSTWGRMNSSASIAARAQLPPAASETMA